MHVEVRVKSIRMILKINKIFKRLDTQNLNNHIEYIIVFFKVFGGLEYSNLKLKGNVI